MPRITDKLVDSSLYTSTQVTAAGNMFLGEWIYENGHKRIVDSKGLYAVNTFAKSGSGYCYINDTGMAQKSGWANINGRRYYINSNIKTGFNVVRAEHIILWTTNTAVTTRNRKA